MEKKWIVIGIIIFAVYAVLHFFIAGKIAKPFLRALFAGGKVSLAQIIGMNLRGNPPLLIVDAYVVLLHSKVQITVSELESLYMANKYFIHNAQSLVELAKKQKSA